MAHSSGEGPRLRGRSCTRSHAPFRWRSMDTPDRPPSSHRYLGESSDHRTERRRRRDRRRTTRRFRATHLRREDPSGERRGALVDDLRGGNELREIDVDELGHPAQVLERAALPVHQLIREPQRRCAADHLHGKGRTVAGFRPEADVGPVVRDNQGHLLRAACVGKNLLPWRRDMGQAPNRPVRRRDEGAVHRELRVEPALEDRGTVAAIDQVSAQARAALPRGLKLGGTGGYRIAFAGVLASASGYDHEGCEPADCDREGAHEAAGDQHEPTRLHSLGDFREPKNPDSFTRRKSCRPGARVGQSSQRVATAPPGLTYVPPTSNLPRMPAVNDAYQAFESRLRNRCSAGAR